MWHRPTEVREGHDLWTVAPVAQLDRAGGFYPSGSVFDSWRGRHCDLTGVGIGRGPLCAQQFRPAGSVFGRNRDFL